MGVFKRNKIYWIDYYHKGRRIREPVSTNKKEAERVLEQRRTEIRQQSFPILKKRKKIKFSEFSESYLADYSIPIKKSYKTDMSIIKNLMKYFGDFYLDDISDFHFDEYRRLRKEQKIKKSSKSISQSTINRELITLGGMLNKASKWYKMTLGPYDMKLTKEEPRERILSEREINLLVSSAEPPLKYVVLVALNTGMRKGEIMKMDWSDISLEQAQGNCFILIKKTKNRKPRIVPMNNSLSELFKKLNKTRGDNRYVFENPVTGENYKDLKRSWYSLLKKIDIRELRFHDLRHTFATNYLIKGGDINTLKEILGHSDISTTGRYLKTPTDYKRKSMGYFEVPEYPGKYTKKKTRKY